MSYQDVKTREVLTVFACNKIYEHLTLKKLSKKYVRVWITSVPPAIVTS
jgi:hypothetical protein